jgi:hypothetical protein
MGVSEAAQQAARHPHAEGIDQLLPEKSLSDGIEDERSLAGKPDEPSIRIDLQEFLQIKLFNSHASFLD